MTVSPQVASDLLLFQILCPLLGSAFAMIASARRRSSIVLLTHLLLLLTGALLCIHVYSDRVGGGTGVIEVSWKLLSASKPVVLEQIVLHADLLNAGILLLLPLASLTAWGVTGGQSWGSLETATGQKSAPFRNLLLVSSLLLALAGADLGTCLTGIFVSALLITSLMWDRGGEERRFTTKTFLTVQWIGGLALMGGLALLIATSSLIQSAPRRVPGPSSAVFPQLGEILQKAITRHESAQELWQDARGLPVLMILAAVFVMSGCFPMHGWMTMALERSSLAVRIWLIVWVKGITLLGIRFLTLLDPSAMQDLQGWGITMSMFGLLYSGGLWLSSKRLSGILGAAVLWSQSLTLLCVSCTTTDFERLVVPLVLGHLASLILLAIVLSLVSGGRDSALLSEVSGIARTSAWIGPSLGVCLATLTLTPSSQGASLAWIALVTLPQWSWMGSLASWGLLLFANLLALGGGVRLITRLFRTPNHVGQSPEKTTAPAQASSEIPVPTPRLRLGPILLIFSWATIAMGFSFLYFEFLRLPAPVDSLSHHDLSPCRIDLVSNCPFPTECPRFHDTDVTSNLMRIWISVGSQTRS